MPAYINDMQDAPALIGVKTDKFDRGFACDCLRAFQAVTDIFHANQCDPFQKSLQRVSR